MSQAKTKAAKKSVKPAAKKVAVVASAALVAAVKKEMGNDEISTCEAVRNVAAKFKKEKPAALINLLVKDHKMNIGTVRRQVFLGRSA